LRHLFIIFAFASPFNLLAQQDPQFSQYMMNPFIWNPSYAALKDEYVISAHHRSQWVGYSPSHFADKISTPSTQLFTFTAPLKKINSGTGFGVTNDNLGPISNLNASFSYAYRISLGIGKLAGGLSVGVHSVSINTELWRPENVNDPQLARSGIENKFNPNAKLGFGYTSNRLFVGFSINNLIRPAFSFKSDQFTNILERHYYVQASYQILLSERVTLQPSAILKSLARVRSAEFGTLFFLDNIWTGLAYRTSDAVTLLLGMNIFPDKSLRVGYSLDFSVINYSAKSLTSHEIFLSYNLGAFMDNRKPIIRTPRFRF